ncbi:prepilin-type N-terminal cleavage/methylation domain protein [Luminiphilus syltensis NOR5-1B]|uniref:Prepilin-type N-terminal cleavage/methylation domain protein n=1 Tax=Luminiphilus syltensis NOR5-1B TaxID=565045 RepID=B8KUV6_9GAMM|nr:prepilin-type N-terminal cleavage/methylation domain-containing protein [Luminiphilus syltensis]EED34671.1 prepilin-type N-terminal cleavage/methylation domain protein [Luminiphilus syltensis NOR5-1B]
MKKRRALDVLAALNGKVQRIRPQTGFTLIELMVAMALGLFIISGAVAMFLANQQSAAVKRDLDNAQDGIRFASQTITRVVREADNLAVAGNTLTVTYDGGAGVRNCLGAVAGAGSNTDVFSVVAGDLQCNGEVITRGVSAFTAALLPDSLGNNVSVRVTLGMAGSALATDFTATARPMVLNLYAGVDLQAIADEYGVTVDDLTPTPEPNPDDPPVEEPPPPVEPPVPPLEDPEDPGPINPPVPGDVCPTDPGSVVYSNEFRLCVQNPSGNNLLAYQEAIDFCSNIGKALPTLDQLQGICAVRGSLGDFGATVYWSSQSQNRNFALSVDFDDGCSSGLSEKEGNFEVRCLTAY